MPEFQLLWRLNQRCNLTCAYCFRQGVDGLHERENPDCLSFEPEQVAAALDATGQRWRIHLTGGEPFLHPLIVPLAQALTRRHRLSVNTNLLPPRITEFAACVDPARLHSLNASYHRDELETRHLKTRWLDTYLAIQQRGFPIRLMFLTHPAWLETLTEETTWLQRQGVREIYFKIFRGPWNGRFYPLHLSPEQRQQTAALDLTPHERIILAGDAGFAGQPCRAGHSAFDLDIRGRFSRCSSVATTHSVLLEGSFRPDPHPRPCPVDLCRCPYQGLHFAQPAATGASGLMHPLAGWLRRRA